MYHIVYKITNTLNNHIYVGIHSTYDIDDGYMGSSKKLNSAMMTEGNENFTREILHYCNTREEAFDKEEEIVTHSFCMRDDTYNSMIGGKQFNKNYILTRDKFGVVFGVHKDDPRYLSGELGHMMKGRVNVKDENGCIINVSNDDPRYLSGELVGCCKGRKKVSDEVSDEVKTEDIQTPYKRKGPTSNDILQKIYKKIYTKSNIEVSHITLDELIEEKESTSIEEMSDKYQISKNAIRKWILTKWIAS